MTLTLTISDAAQATRLLNDYCNGSGWTSGSGVTKAEWMKQQLASHVRQVAKRGEIKDSIATINTAIDAIAIT